MIDCQSGVCKDWASEGEDLLSGVGDRRTPRNVGTEIGQENLRIMSGEINQIVSKSVAKEEKRVVKEARRRNPQDVAGTGRSRVGPRY